MHFLSNVFRRVIPEQEINATERDQFWEKEEMEEKKRLEQERLRCEQERQKLEREIRAREEKETQLREQQVCSDSVYFSIIYVYIFLHIYIIQNIVSGNR